MSVNVVLELTQIQQPLPRPLPVPDRPSASAQTWTMCGWLPSARSQCPLQQIGGKRLDEARGGTPDYPAPFAQFSLTEMDLVLNFTTVAL